MNKQQILQLAQQDPNIARAVDAIEAEVGDMPITPEGLGELIQMLEFALERPDAWPQVRAAAVADGLVDEEDLPQQFDPTVIISLLVVMYQLQQRAAAPQQRMARGGLAQAGRALAAQGRGGDTMLAHINPREAAMLRRAGGSGSINPRTGLPEYGFLKKLFKVALPIVLNFVAPGLGTAIGTALGATGTAAAMLGSAIIGGVSAGITGGDPLKGALLGGLGGGLGTTLGASVSEGLGLGLGATGQSVLGGALVGAGSSALTGGNVLKGAVMGGLGSAAGNALQGVGEGAIGSAIGAGGKTFGNMLAAGFSPKEAIAGGGLSGLLAGMSSQQAAKTTAGLKPSEQVLQGLKDAPAPGTEMVTAGELDGGGEPLTYSTPQPKTSMTDPAFQGAAQSNYGFTAPQPTTSMSDPAFKGADPGLLGKLTSNPLQMLTAASMLSSLGGAPAAAQQAVAAMSPAQQEYFNRPQQQFDWQRMQQDASAAGMDLRQFMAQNWNAITSGVYSAPVQRMARGGALAAAGQLLQGAGSGRDDTIDAKLSDGEYVMDAETVAMLGDGSNKEGARRLDQMRARLRQHKGKTLARGKFSPNAKSPLAYLKG